MSRWFRHYAGMMRDEKLVSAAVKSKQPVERVVWVYGAILESAAEINDGGRYEFDADEASYFLRCDASELVAITSVLETLGRLRDGYVAQWKARQFEADSSTERVRKYRAKRSGTETEMGGNGTNGECNDDETLQQRFVTPPYTDTDTDIKEIGLSDAGAKLETKLREAAGWQNEPAPMLAVTGEIEAMLGQGASLDLDVLPILKALGSQPKRRTTWKYFIPAIRDAWQSRVNATATGPPVAEIVPFNTRNIGELHENRRPKHSRARNFEIIDAIVAEAERREAAEGIGSVQGLDAGQT
jgi:hypothetical protein